jgi:hypothetical protein
MKVNLFNHWFKYKVPADKHFDSIQSALIKSWSFNPWEWLDAEHDVGQYYNWRESRNYLVFHNEKHYLTFLLKL